MIVGNNYFELSIISFFFLHIHTDNKCLKIIFSPIPKYVQVTEKIIKSLYKQIKIKKEKKYKKKYTVIYCSLKLQLKTYYEDTLHNDFF